MRDDFAWWWTSLMLGWTSYRTRRIFRIDRDERPLTRYILTGALDG